jgi:glycosyltransferase involved in cell wall biosynthesis
LRIFFATAEYLTNRFGGAGVYAWNLTKNLASTGHEVHVATWGLNETPRVANLHIHRIMPFKQINGLPNAFYAVFFILALPLVVLRLNKKVGGFDIIHSNAQFFTPMAILLGALFLPTIRKIPKIITLHHLDNTEYSVERSLGSSNYLTIKDLENKLSGAIESFVIKQIPVLIVVSSFTERNLSKVFDVSKKKVFVIPNGLALATPDINNFPIKKNNGEIWLLTIGRMEPRKGIPVLVNAFKKLSSEYDNLTLFLIGKGMNKVLDFQVPEKAKFSIKTFDRLNDIQLSSIYNLCDIYISSSLLEGFGLTILEAMASGKPVVAVKCGAIPEFVKEGLNGFLVKPNDPQAIVDALKKLIVNPQLRGAMGSINEIYAKETFNWQNIAKETLIVYSALTKKIANTTLSG